MPAFRNVPRLDRHVYNNDGWDAQGIFRHQGTLPIDTIPGGVRFDRITSRTEDGHVITTNHVEADRVEQLDAFTTSTSTNSAAAVSNNAPYSAYPASAPAVGSTRNHSRRKDPYHIPRPRNAFICFRSEYVHKGLGSSDQQNELSKDAAQAWARMSDAEKQVYRDRALAEKLLHKKLFPHYVYSPGGKNGADGAKSNASTAAGQGGRKKAKTHLVAAVNLEIQSSSEKSSSPEPLHPGNASIIGAPQASTYSSSELSSSESSWTPSPLVHAALQDKKEESVLISSIPALDLPSTVGRLRVGYEQTFDPSFITAPTPLPLHPIPLDSLGFGPGYGFRSDFDPAMLYEPLPDPYNLISEYADVHVGVYGANEVASPAMPTSLSLPHPHQSNDLSIPFDDLNFLTDFSSSFASASYPDSELDLINSSLASLDLNYDQGLECSLTEAELENLEVEVFDYPSFFAAYGNDKGKEKVEGF